MGAALVLVSEFKMLASELGACPEGSARSAGGTGLELALPGTDPAWELTAPGGLGTGHAPAPAQYTCTHTTVHRYTRFTLKKKISVVKLTLKKPLL